MAQAQSAKVVHRIFKDFEIKAQPYIIFYALSNGANKIFIFVTVYEGDIFLFSIKVSECKSYNSSYNR